MRKASLSGEYVAQSTIHVAPLQDSVAPQVEKNKQTAKTNKQVLFMELIARAGDLFGTAHYSRHAHLCLNNIPRVNTPPHSVPCRHSKKLTGEHETVVAWSDFYDGVVLWSRLVGLRQIHAVVTILPWARARA